MFGGPAEGNTLRLEGLPELRTLTLNGIIGVPANMIVNAASFRGAPKLQALRLRSDAGLEMQAGSLQQLTALTALTLEDCGLRSVPADLASLSATLCVLDLSNNDHLQVEAATVDSICGCSQLRTLALYKRDISEWQDDLAHSAWREIRRHTGETGYIPAQFSSESLAQLVRLPSAFRKQHGRDLDVILALSDYRAFGCRC